MTNAAYICLEFADYLQDILTSWHLLLKSRCLIYRQNKKIAILRCHQEISKIATTASKMGMVRHLEIRYHLVRCVVLSGNIELVYCITEEMLADLFTKVVSSAQDKRLAIRFYYDCVMD